VRRVSAAQSRDAVAAFNPTERRQGKTIIRVRPWIIVAFWIAAIVATLLRLCNLADLSRHERRRKNHRGTRGSFWPRLQANPARIQAEDPAMSERSWRAHL
jgi:hypothetical protein